MNLEQFAVFDEYYRGLRLNGWPKDRAAQAALNLVRPYSVLRPAK